MTLESHVAALCKSAFFHIRNIARIKRYLSQANIETLIHAFVTCKFATYWLLLQNCAAWLVVGGRKYDPVTSVFRQLHWLPIEKRIVCRINCSQPIMLCNGLAPLYTCMCDRLELGIPILAGFDHLIIM